MSRTTPLLRLLLVFAILLGMLPAPQVRAQEPVTPDVPSADAPPPNSLFLPLMSGGEPPKTEDADASFRFRADPLLGTVVIESSPPPQARPASGRSSSRILLADSELSRVQFTFEFQTGNRLVIRAAYKNVTGDSLFLQPFFFSRNSRTDNIVTSTEPILSADDLGGDGVLGPDETTHVVLFEVVHKGQPFIYAVDANAPVELLSAQTGPDSPAVFTGEVYDDSSGLALSGVIVEVVGNARSLNPTITRTVTDERGRYRLVSEDRDVWVRFSKDGYTGSERAASAPGDSRVELFDARMRPIDSKQTMIPAVSGGTATASDSRYSLTLQPFALQNDTTFTLTPIGGQSIAGLLPKGWSPVAAVQIDPSTGSGQRPAGLTFNPAAVFTLPAPDGLPESGRIVAAHWESALRGWVAVTDAARNGDNTALQLSVASSGQYVLLLADAAPFAPVDPLTGAVLRQAATPRSLPGDPAVAMSPSDRILLAEQGRNTQVSVTAIAQQPMQSGMAYQVEFVESYEFVDGATIYPEPNIQDFVFYSFPGGPFRLESDFNVTPSRPFELATLRLGAVVLRLRAPVGLGLPSGELVSLTGSTVTGAGGETLDFPPAATLSTLPVVLTSLDQSGFPVDLPADFTFLKGVQLDFAGGALQRPVTLSTPAPGGVTGSDQLLLIRLVEVGSGSRLVLAGRAQLLDGRLVAGPESSDGLPFYGVRREGRYAFVKVTTPRSFVFGVVAGTNGQPLAGGLVSAENRRLAALTDPNGQYVLAVPPGPVTVVFADPRTNDQASRSGEAGATPLQLNVSLSPTPPSVQSITPVEGATGVSLSSAVVVSFTEAIDVASVTAESVRLLNGGEALPASLSITPNRRVVVLRPSQLLASDTLYTIDITTAIRDLNGRPLTAAVTASFRTADTTPPLPPPAGSVRASVPENGFSTVTGTQGTVQPDWVVVIKNLTTGALTTVLPKADGSFSVRVPAEKQHKLQLQMQDASGNRTEVAVGRFSSPDGSVVVGSEGGTVEGEGGTAVEIPAGAFPDGTLVKVSPINEGDLPLPAPGDYPFVGAVELTTDGARSRTALDLSVPAPPDASPDDQVVVARFVIWAGGSGWMVADRAVLQDGRYTTATPPAAARFIPGEAWNKGIVDAGQYAFLRSSGDCTSYISVAWTIGFDFVVLGVLAPFAVVPSFNVTTDTNYFPATCNRTLEIEFYEINTGRVFRRINQTAPSVRNGIAAAVEKSISDDKKPPTIVRHNLYNNYQTERIEVYFSKVMNPDSVLNGLRLTPHTGPIPAIDAALVFSETALWITPTVPFQFSIQYTLELNDAEDSVGNPLTLKEPLRFSIFEPQNVTDLADVSGPALGSQAVAQIGDLLFVARTPTLTNTTGLVVDIPIQELRVYSTTVITKPVEVGFDYTGLRHLRALTPIADVFAKSTDANQTIQPFAIFTVTVESQAEALTITTGLNTDVISPALASLFASAELTLARKALVHQFTPQPGSKWFIESQDDWYLLEQLNATTFRASVGRDLLVVLGTTEPTTGRMELLEIYDVTPCTKPQFVPAINPDPANCLDIGRMTISRKVLTDPQAVIPINRPIPNRGMIAREIGVPLQTAVLHQRTADTLAVYVVTSGVGLQAIDITRAPNMPTPLFTDPAPNAFLRGRFRDVAVLKNLVLAGEDPLNNNFPRVSLLTPQLTRMKSQDGSKDLVIPVRGFLAVTTAQNVHYDVDNDKNFGEVEDEDGDDGVQAVDELFDLALVTTGRLDGDRNLLWVVDLSDYTDLSDNQYAAGKGIRVIDAVYLPMPARTVQADADSHTAYVEVDGEGLYAVDLRRLVSGLTSNNAVDSLSFPTFDDADRNNSDDRILGFYRMVGISNRQEIVVDSGDNRPLAYLNEFNNGIQLIRICNSCQELTLDFKRGQYENFVDEDADPNAPPESKTEFFVSTPATEEAEPSGTDGGSNSNKDAEKVRELYIERETLMILLAGSVYSLTQSIEGLQPKDIYMIEQGSGACLWRDDFVGHELQVCSAFTPGVSDHDFEIFLPAHYVRRGQGVLDDFVANPPTDEYRRRIKTLDDFSLFVMPSEPFNAGTLLSSPPMNKEGDTAGDLGLGRQSLLLLWLLTTGDYIKFNGEGTPLAGRLPVNEYGKGPSLDHIVECMGLNQLIILTQNSSGQDIWRCDDPEKPMFAGEPSGIPLAEGYEWARLQEYNVYKMSALLRVKNGCDFVNHNPQGEGLFEERDSDSILPPNDPDRFFEDNEAFRDDCKSQVKTIAKSAIRTLFARMVGDVRTNALLFDGVYRFNPDGTSILNPETNQHELLPLTRSNVQKGEFCLTELQSPENAGAPVNPNVVPTVPTNAFQYYPKRCEGFEEYIASMAIESVRRRLGVFDKSELPLLWSLWCVKVWKGCQVGGVTVNYIQSDIDATNFIRAALDFIERTQTATIAVYTARNAADSVTLGQLANQLGMQDYPFIREICNLCLELGVTLTLSATRTDLRNCTLQQADIKVNGKDVNAGLALFGDEYVLGPESGLIGKAKKYLGVKNSIFWALQTRLSNESPNDLYDIPLALYEGAGQTDGAYDDALVYHEVPFLPAGGRSVINQKKVSKKPAESPPLAAACAAIPSRELPDYDGQVKTWTQSTLFPLLFAVPKVQEKIGVGTDKFHAVAFVADPDHEYVEANRENNQSGFYYYLLDKGQVNPPVPTVTGHPAFVLSNFASDAICLDGPALDFDMTMRPKGSNQAGVKILEVGVDTEVELVLTVRNNGVTPLKNVRIFSDRIRRIEKAALAPDEVYSEVIDISAANLGRFSEYAYATARDGDNNSVGPVHDRADLLVAPKLKALQIRLYDASPLNVKGHPFSRYEVMHMRDNDEAIPVAGATTDPQSRLRIELAVGLATTFGPNQTELPAEPISLTLKDVTVFAATEGFGNLVHEDLSGQIIVSGTQISIQNPTTLGKTTNVYYIPPPVFVRKEHWRGDTYDETGEPRRQRKVRLEVVQTAYGAGSKDIALIRPPVFVFHGLGGLPTTWNKFRPFVPDRGVNLNRAYPVPGYDGRFFLYAAGTEGSVYSVAVEAADNFAIFNQALGGRPLRDYAVARVDVIGNSMGGLLTREIARQSVQIKNVAPIFRKLITIGTPHLGSPLASRVVEIRDSTRLDPDSTWLDMLIPSVEGETNREVINNFICALGIQNLTAFASQDIRMPEMDIYSGALDDLQEGSGFVQRMHIAGVLVPSHYIVGNNDTTSLAGEGFTQITLLWKLLGGACNWVPDPTLVDSSQGDESDLKWRIIKVLVSGNVTRAWQLFKSLRSFVDPPTPILPVGNDRIVPEVSQRDGLPLGHRAVTSFTGLLDHLDIKETFQSSDRQTGISVCDEYLKTVWENLDGQVRHTFTDRNQTPCQVVALLELDPADEYSFIQPSSGVGRAAIGKETAAEGGTEVSNELPALPSAPYIKPSATFARSGSRTPPVMPELTVIDPVPNGIVRSGQMLDVTIHPPAGVNLTRVIAGFASGEDTVLALSPATSVPVTLSVSVPVAMAGPDTLLVLGLDDSGEAYAAGVELLINPGPLNSLDILASALLLRPGQVEQVVVEGRFADGERRDLTSARTGTTYESTKPAVLAVSADGRIQARSNGRATLRVTNIHLVTGARYVETLEITVALGAAVPNGIPVADAGAAQAVPTETVIHLSAADSTDPDDDPLSFYWRQTSGQTTFLIDANTAAPYFISPLVAQPETLTFELVVRDDKGAETLPVEVSVTVNP